MTRSTPPRSVAARRPRHDRSTSVKVTGLAQKLGQLEAVNRDLQPKSWANLQLLGQPCNFPASRARQVAEFRRVLRPGGDGAPPGRAVLLTSAGGNADRLCEVR